MQQVPLSVSAEAFTADASLPPEPATEPELHSSLEAALAERPVGPRAGIWLFVYGSMAGEPPFEAAETTTGVAEGYERRFCIADPVLRGDRDRPGLVLGLIPGNSCEGVAFRLGEIEAADSLIEVWRREMLYPFYRAAWVAIRLESGRRVHALTFLADEDGALFSPVLGDEETARILRDAVGPSGANLQYLTETIDGLARHGVRDPLLDALAERIPDGSVGL